VAITNAISSSSKEALGVTGLNKGQIAILGFAESFSSPEVAWSLADSGFRVLAFARRDSRAALRVSRYATVFDVTPPEQDAAATIRELAAEIERLLVSTDSKAALLPLDDAALWVCSQLKPDQQLAIVGPARPDVALQKDVQISTARDAGFRVPKTIVVGSKRELTAAPFVFPLILKPALAISFRNGKLFKGRFRICDDASDFELALRGFMDDEPILVQEYVSGIGEGLFGLAERDGVSNWSSHRRIRMMNPLGSGASACVSVAAEADDVTAGAKFIAQIGWRGPFMLELLRDHQGRTWFMEFNGRVWGSTALARRCGLEYPAWAVIGALDENRIAPQKVKPPLGIVCRHAGREILHGLFVLRGSRTKNQLKWPPRWHTLMRLLKIKRSERWYNWRRDDWRVFFRDIFATIAEVVFKKASS
jgi:predicted ATP-grasp superfamily ATP-dependent carboligase